MSALTYDDRVLLERFVPGRELAISVLGTAEPWALPVVEAIPREREFYDFEARYTPGSPTSWRPPASPTPSPRRPLAWPIQCFRALGCRGLDRVDMILDPDDRLWVLEINPIPGMTDTSLLPKAAEAAGLGFDEVVERILADDRAGPEG